MSGRRVTCLHTGSLTAVDVCSQTQLEAPLEIVLFVAHAEHWILRQLFQLCDCHCCPNTHHHRRCQESGWYGWHWAIWRIQGSECVDANIRTTNVPGWEKVWPHALASTQDKFVCCCFVFCLFVCLYFVLLFFFGRVVFLCCLFFILFTVLKLKPNGAPCDLTSSRRLSRCYLTFHYTHVSSM